MAHSADPADRPATGSQDLGALVASLRATLASRGPLAALGLLNARTRFRFTGVYRTEPPLLRNIALFDRENPALNVSGSCGRLDGTFCVFVWGSEAPYCVSDATADEGLRRYTSQDTVLSYAGVPIRSPSGQVVGTLCHFDGRPRILPPGELQAMEAIAPVLAEWLASNAGSPVGSPDEGRGASGSAPSAP